MSTFIAALVTTVILIFAALGIIEIVHGAHVNNGKMFRHGCVLMSIVILVIFVLGSYVG
jgi:uncharacterized membrane protein